MSIIYPVVFTKSHESLTNARRSLQIKKARNSGKVPNRGGFTTRLRINNEPIDVITSSRLLGTIISDDLKWDLDCANIV